MTVGFVSLGCAKNLVDSEYIASSLAACGIGLAPSPDEADVIIVNTCAFIGDAKQESIDAILEACETKQAGRCRAVIVAGCMPQRYKEELRETMPEVDAFVGLDALDDVPALVRGLARGKRKGTFRVPAKSEKLFEPASRGLLFTGGAYSYVKIAEGCDHRCSFCVIPDIRGSYRSRTEASIVRQAERLLENGVRELNLISQDTTLYGRDLGDGTNLPRLLRALGAIGGRFWIRLLYGHPAHLTDELMDAVCEVPQVCRYLDLPIQHSHPEMLRLMRRPAGRAGAGVRSMPARVRERIPDVTLRTTCLVGHPGETREFFEDLLRFVRDAEFERLGVFAYSPEEGTPAFRMPGSVDGHEALERREELMLAQQKIVLKKARKLVGREEEILIESPGSDGGGVVGRSARHAPEVDGGVLVRCKTESGVLGSFTMVRYTGADDYDMLAEFVAAAGTGRTGRSRPR